MSVKLPDNLSKLFEKLGNALKNLDEKNLYLIFGFVLLLIFALNFFILMQPQLNSLYKLGPNIKTLAEDIAKVKGDSANVEEYKKQIEKLSDEFSKVRAKVRSKEEVSLILEKISLIADKNKIRIDQIAPVFPDQTKIMQSKDMIYLKLPIDIDAKSTYHDLGRFINQLENSDIFLKVSGFSIAYVEAAKENIIKLTVDAIIFEKVKTEEKK